MTRHRNGRSTCLDINVVRSSTACSMCEADLLKNFNDLHASPHAEAMTAGRLGSDPEGSHGDRSVRVATMFDNELRDLVWLQWLAMR